WPRGEAVLEVTTPAGPRRADEIGHERLGGQVRDTPEHLPFQDLMPDGIHQMRLAEPKAAVDEERVVVIPWLRGDRLARGVRELVRGSDDEVGKRVLGVEGGVYGAQASVGSAPSRIGEELPLVAHGQIDHHLAR